MRLRNEKRSIHTRVGIRGVGTAALTFLLVLPGCRRLEASREETGQTPGSSGADVRSMQLVASGAGWALTERGLNWTNDGGQSWADITPGGLSASNINGVFFINSSHGWLLTATQSDITVLRTSNQGSTWIPSILPPLPATEPPYGGEATLDFVSLEVGWVSLRLESSSNVSRGALYGTKDGGVTWTLLSVPIGEPVRFLDEGTGWTAGGAAGDEFYVTQDGGNTWERESVTPPAILDGRYPTYELPFFTSAEDGVLPVTFDGSPSGVGFYAIHDQGRSWELVATLRIPQELHPGVDLPIDVVGGVWLVGSIGGQALSVGRNNGQVWQERDPKGMFPGLLQLEFVSADAGWALSQTGLCEGFKTDCHVLGRLLQTADGGATWANIGP
jgi:photosystem II stability/assembly factor-like uncharacterized protein